MLPASTRFSQCSSSRSSWLIAIRSILQPCGCQEELSTWLKAELFIWPRHACDHIVTIADGNDILTPHNEVSWIPLFAGCGFARRLRGRQQEAGGDQGQARP